MLRNILTFFLIQFITLSVLFGRSDYRDGYIITLKEDTVKGKIDYQVISKSYKSCTFKNNNSEIREYFPDQIKGFGFINDKFFTSQIIENSFVEVLVWGDLSLFVFEGAFIVRKDGEIVRIGSPDKEIIKNGSTVVKEDLKWRGVLTYLISDCIQNPNEFTSNLQINEKSLSNLAARYNKCSGNDFIVFKENLKWTRINFGLSVGLVHSKINTNRENSPVYPKSFESDDLSIGLSMVISFPRISERISVNTGILFLESKFLYEKEEERAFDIIHDDFHIDIQTISLPVSFQYNLPEKFLGFYAQAGMNFDFNYNYKSVIQSYAVDKPTGEIGPIFEDKDPVDISDFQIGFLAGVGISKSFKGFSSRISAQFVQMLNLFNDQQFRGTTAHNDKIIISLILMK